MISGKHFRWIRRKRFSFIFILSILPQENRNWTYSGNVETGFNIDKIFAIFQRKVI